MGIFNLLASDPVITFLGQTYNVSLNGIGKLINALISGIGIVGVGIIVFSLILKCIVLPFDVYQRISMRKQNIKMKENKEKLEKLQKQYANDKKMYSQKMMELQKEQGFSMLSSCLPMIISLVIFFVAIGAFNDYSAYANLQNYNLLVKAYNDALKEKLSPYTYDEYCALSDEEKTAIAEAAQYAYNVAVNSFDEEANKALIEENAEKEMKLAAENAVRQVAENAVQKAATEAKTAALNAYKAEDHTAELDANTGKAIAQTAENTVRTKANDYCKDIAQTKVFEAYENGVKMNFLWIKNIWNADTFWTKPINKYDDFIKNIGNYAKPGKGIPEDQLNKMLNSAKYGDVMGKLLDDPEYNSANGYMILPVLTVLLSVAMQVLSYRQQKQGGQMNAQSESTSKIMMFVMPVFMAWFAFSYTAAFALYLVMSYVVSIAISLIGSLVVKIADKKTEKALVTEVQQYGRPDFSDRKNDKNDK